MKMPGSVLLTGLVLGVVAPLLACAQQDPSPAPDAAPPASAPADSAPSDSAPAVALTAVDLFGLDYNLDGIDLYRSSVFFNPRTRFGAQSYAAFPDHHASRIFGAFNWEISKSTDLMAFRMRLERKREGIQRFALVNDKFIISINYMPSWLSRSNDRTHVDGFYEVRNTVGPRDEAGWKDVVRALVRFYAQFDGVDMYYELWNEPDLEYWQEDVDAYLRLYEVTMRTVKEADPRAKVGGSATSNFNTKPKKSPDREPLNIELIRFAKERDVPLDFISWHDFTGLGWRIDRAVRAYEAEFDAVGYDPHPELLVTEWNVAEPFRLTRYQAAMMAEVMFAFRKTGVAVQTAAAWENFHPDPDRGGYGMVTQGGRRMGGFHVHAAFDRLSRDSLGLALIEEPPVAPQEGVRRMVVSRKSERRFELAVWENGFAPPEAEAVRQMIDDGMTGADFARYAGVPGITAAIRGGRARDPRHQQQFEKARAVAERHPIQRRPLVLQLAGVARIDVLSAKVIRDDVREVEVRVEGDRITYDLDKFEVLVLEIEVEPVAEGAK